MSRMPKRKNPYSDRLIDLRNYINSGIDPHDFAYLFEDFLEEQGLEGEAEGFDPDEPYNFLNSEAFLAFEDDFRSWLEDGPAYRDISTDSPAYLTMSRAKLVPRQTWLVHFSDDADDIARNGFLYGHEDARTLALTTWFRNRKMGPGWNFSLRAGGRDAQSVFRKGKYGKNAVLFRSAGVEVYHSGDEETQVILWGPNAHDFILLTRDGDDVVIEDEVTGRELRRGSFEKVVEWAMSYADQYRHRIIHTSIVKKQNPRSPMSSPKKTASRRRRCPDVKNSIATSRPIVPTLHKELVRLKLWKRQSRNLDLGGGRYNKATEYLAAHGVHNLVVDPSRGEEHNDAIMAEVARRPVRSVTVANVLNVICSARVRQLVIERAAKAIGPKGFVGFQIYEGDESGVGGATRDGWQENRAAGTYLPEISRWFDMVEARGNIFIAMEPRAKASGPVPPDAPVKSRVRRKRA